MLAADKLLLQSSIRQNAISLKEKEFSLHHGNFNAVGTQAAVLAGFTVTAFIEFDCPDGSPRSLKFFYYIASIVSLSANILCVANTTFLSVWGTGLAMRGPDGSMARAVDGMYQLRRNVFLLFGVGMMSLLLTGIFGSWLLMDPEAAAASTLLLVYAIYLTFKSYKSITNLFHFDEDDAVNFDDLLDATQTLIPTAKTVRAAVRRSSSASPNNSLRGGPGGTPATSNTTAAANGGGPQGGVDVAVV